MGSSTRIEGVKLSNSEVESLLKGALLKHSTKDERHRGDYKKFPNHVEPFGADGKSKGVIFETVSPFDTPQRMKGLRNSPSAAHRNLRGGVSSDSSISGRQWVPYSSLERVIEENKDGYYLALRQAEGLGAWLVFFLRSMQKQKITLERKLTAELAATEANRNTLKVHLRRLTSDGLIVAEGVGRGVRYRLKG